MFRLEYLSDHATKPAAAGSRDRSHGARLSILFILSCILAVAVAVLYPMHLSVEWTEEQHDPVDAPVHANDTLAPFQTTMLDMTVLNYYTTYYNPTQLRMQRRSMQGEVAFVFLLLILSHLV
jgi:hypothetical protein